MNIKTIPDDALIHEHKCHGYIIRKRKPVDMSQLVWVTKSSAQFPSRTLERM